MNDRISNFVAALADQAREEANLALAPFRPRQEQLRAALFAVDVKDDEDARRALDKIALSRALRAAADSALQPIGNPYRDAAHAVAGAAASFMADLQEMERRATRSLDSFRNRQREAAAAAATEQREREEELRRQAGLKTEAPALPVRPSDVRLESVRSDYRAQAFDRKFLKVTITDPRALPDTILNAPAVRTAMETAVRRLAALDRNIAGALIEDDVKTNVKAG